MTSWLFNIWPYKQVDYFDNLHLDYYNQSIHNYTKNKPWFSNYSGYLNNDNVIPFDQIPYKDAQEAIINNSMNQEKRHYIN
jgi:hypothetical protein